MAVGTNPASFPQTDQNIRPASHSSLLFFGAATKRPQAPAQQIYEQSTVCGTHMQHIDKLPASRKAVSRETSSEVEDVFALSCRKNANPTASQQTPSDSSSAESNAACSSSWTFSSECFS